MQIFSDTVAINHIDLNDTTFKISTDISTDDLIESIENIGLISPVILKSKADSRYIVVSGFRRVAACRLLGRCYIDARIINEDKNNLYCLKLAIADNALTRQLNVIEQADSISKLSAFYADEIELSRESQKIGLNVNPGLIKKLRKLIPVHHSLKNKIAVGIIPFSIALELNEMEEETATAFSQIIEALHPTLNHQKEIIRLTKEIARLKNISILDVINKFIVTDLFSDPELDRNHKIKKIRRDLKQIRYPEIIRFESNFFNLLNQIKLPEAIHLVPPKDFEGINYSMQLNFQSLTQFKGINHVLNKLQDHPDFAKILEKEFEDN
ncbi:MAG: ParB/RepB/Spo0J family partition protein [Desulfobacteraceae bacterium]|nr:ParB/RepB/Spo0J family partition protein [Desulfobacteraceae bacterium]